MEGGHDFGNELLATGESSNSVHAVPPSVVRLLLRHVSVEDLGRLLWGETLLSAQFLVGRWGRLVKRNIISGGGKAGGRERKRERERERERGREREKERERETEIDREGEVLKKEYRPKRE